VCNPRIIGYSKVHINCTGYLVSQVLCSANLNIGKEMLVAKFMALSQHLPKRIEEIMKILMQYIKCTSHDLIQTNVTN